ncbi:Cna B-type domain-containing protein, partial [Ligilactobacillus ceti]
MFKKAKTWLMLASMLASFAVTPVTSVIQANNVTQEKVVNPQAMQSEPVPSPQANVNNAKWDAKISWPQASDNHPYSGGSVISLYNHIQVSGTQNVMQSGSMVVNTLPKAQFEKPVATDFKKITNKKIKDIKVIDDPNDTNYKIVITLNKMLGGEKAAIPIKIRLKAYDKQTNQGTQNLSKNTVKIDFMTQTGQIVSSSDFTIIGQAVIHGLSNNYANVHELSHYVIDGEAHNYKFKPNTILNKSGYISDLNLLYLSNSDPRMRRLYAKIPQEFKVDTKNTAWKYDAKLKQYYKDIPVNEYNMKTATVPIDVSGFDMAPYTSINKVKEFKIHFTLRALNPDGSIATDLEPVRYFNDTKIFIDITKWGGKFRFQPQNWIKAINQDYQPLMKEYHKSLYGNTYLTKGLAVADVLKNYLIRYTNQNVLEYKYDEVTGGMQKDATVKIVSGSINIPMIRTIKKVRLMYLGDLTAQEKADLTKALKGTKVYGYSYPGHKTLLTDNVPIYFGSDYKSSFNKEKYRAVNPDNKYYNKIEFVYPNGGLTFKTKAVIKKMITNMYDDVILGFNPAQINSLLKSSGGNNNAQGAAELTAVDSNGQNLHIIHGNSYGFDKVDFNYNYFTTLKNRYEKKPDTDIQRTDKNKHEKVPIFNTWDETIIIKSEFQHQLTGLNNLKINNPVTPQNETIYYLVPKDTFPAKQQPDLKIKATYYGYTKTQNLIVAQVLNHKIDPKTIIEPWGTIEEIKLHLRISPSMRIGKYDVKVALAIDNNKPGFKNGKNVGIKEENYLPDLKWNGIPITTKYNHSEIPGEYTDLGSTEFKYHPPGLLIAYKHVKAHGEIDQHYGLSTGKSVTFNDEIDYRIALRNDQENNSIERLTAIDILPYKGDYNITPNKKGEYTKRNSQFKTPLIGVDKSDKFDIYYSTDKPVKELNNNLKATWMKTLPKDPAQVTMIKFVLKQGQELKENEEAVITLHAKMPSDNRLADQAKAYNSFAFTDASTLDADGFIESLESETVLSYRRTNVKLIKKDRKTKQPLAGAEFSLYSDKEKKVIKEHLKTNDQGEVELPDLVVGFPYTLTETKAPKGYYINDQKLKFVAKEKQTLEFLDQFDRKIDISVHKNWIDAPADKPAIKLQLMRDGQAFQKPVTLDHNQLDYKWNVSQYSPAGKLYNYTVQEVGGKNNQVVLAGQTYAVSTTKTSNHTIITNTNVGQTISVVKKWADDQNRDKQRPDKIHIHLLANGQAVKEADLDENHQWQVDFTQLPVYENGQKIKYTVTEDQVHGYQATIEQKDNNFIITNKHEVALTT